MLLLLCSVVVGLLASAQGYRSCTPWGQCTDVNTADGYPCCEHIARDEVCPDIAIAPRDWWRAKPPKRFSPLSSTASEYEMEVGVIETEACGDLLSCLKKVEGMQNSDMEAGMGDIAYNYLISAQGRMFLGRGRDQAADAPNRQKTVIMIPSSRLLCFKPLLRLYARILNCLLKYLKKRYPGKQIKLVTKDKKGNRVYLPSPVTAEFLYQLWC